MIIDVVETALALSREIEVPIPLVRDVRVGTRRLQQQRPRVVAW